MCCMRTTQEGNMAEDKLVQVGLRVPESWRDALTVWSETEHRSLNGQILLIIEKALAEAGRMPKKKAGK